MELPLNISNIFHERLLVIIIAFIFDKYPFFDHMFSPKGAPLIELHIQLYVKGKIC
jgi:hypothetical protein